MQSILPASITQASRTQLRLAGNWTALHLSDVLRQMRALPATNQAVVVADAQQVQALDTVGAWTLHHLLAQLRAAGTDATVHGLTGRPQEVWQQLQEGLEAAGATPPSPAVRRGPAAWLEQVGRRTVHAAQQVAAWLAFLGEVAHTVFTCLRQPSRIRWRPILFNIRSAGVDALPIVGLLSFLLGIVVAYQAAEQLRRYGANIFVADLVGLSMLREFAPLMTAIIVAGRSGSAYAAQIGTMAVTEEVDAMRTMAIVPMEMLVLPKLVAMVVALPLLTVFADMMGVLGGMVMAQAQLGVPFADFLDRFANAVSISSLLVGVGKAPVFAAIVVVVGCYQGMATRGGADAVGRQTTRSVVQSIFFVIVADALFSVAFSVLGL